MVESGRIMRSTEEWLMSRSCHTQIFSKAAWELARKMRDSPETPFAGNRIAFMRHGRGTDLTLEKWLFHFQHFSFLQKTDLRGNFVEC